MEITIRIPEVASLADAINNLAGALRGCPKSAPAVADQQPAAQVIPLNTPVQTVSAAPVAPAADPTVLAVNPAPVAAPMPAAPMPAAPMPAAPMPAAAPASAAIAPAPVVPVQTAPATPVSFDQLVAAGSQLLNVGRMNDLLALLGQFGVQAITQLKPEQYNDVAVALRGLGANI